MFRGHIFPVASLNSQSWLDEIVIYWWLWDEPLWCLMQREWQSWCERTWKDEITLPVRLCRQNKWQKRKKLCSHHNKIYFKSSQITSAVCGKLSYKKKITSLFIKWQNIRQSSYRRFFVLYPTIFTEPEANNCFSIIALVLSNSFVNSFCCWNHSVTIVLITRVEIRI